MVGQPQGAAGPVNEPIMPILIDVSVTPGSAACAAFETATQAKTKFIDVATDRFASVLIVVLLRIVMFSINWPNLFDPTL
jgi:hypothetical protein